MILLAKIALGTWAGFIFPHLHFCLALSKFIFLSTVYKNFFDSINNFYSVFNHIRSLDQGCSGSCEISVTDFSAPIYARFLKFFIHLDSVQAYCARENQMATVTQPKAFHSNHCKYDYIVKFVSYLQFFFLFFFYLFVFGWM